MLRLLLALLVAALAAPTASTQTERPPAPPRVYLDCQTGACDSDFFQTELPVVQFVRDPAGAAVSVLVLEDDTGGGGERYTLYFQGRGRLAGRRDTLRTDVPPAASDDDERRAVLSRLALGLVPYVVASGLGDRVAVTYSTEGLEAQAEPVRDPWGGWVFTLDASGYANGEQRSSQFNAYGAARAARTTDDWKIRLGTDGSYREQRFTYETDAGTDTTTVSTVTNYGGSAYAARSLSAHWSAGGAVSAGTQSFRNYDLRVRAGPAVEYSLFPYAEATERQVRVLYAVGVEAAVYADTTVYLQKDEVLPQHQLTVAAEFNRPWGEFDLSVDASQYLDDPAEFYRVGVNGDMSVRVARGLQLRLSGGGALVRDQRYLPAGEATAEEVLTRQQALATGYEYYVSAGVSYSFGSILNAVVNPRFGGGRPF